VTYDEFLQQKVAIAESYGFDVALDEIHPLLKDFQKAIVQWAVKGGRRALFEAFGLGKTLQQLEILRLILKHSGGGEALIVCPLGVRQEFMTDARKIDLRVAFIRTNEELKQVWIGDPPHIFITNYESIREGKLDPRGFKAVSLDEAAILRSFGGTKTFRRLMGLFEGTSTYRFVATATPSPNEYLELAAYSDFLGIMDTGQVKTRFFKRDSTLADHLTLHEHKKVEFYKWLTSWSMFLQRPSDLGIQYSNEGYDLPSLDIHWHEIPSTHEHAGYERDGQRRLIQDTTISVQNAAREKRDSLEARLEKLLELRRYAPAAHRIIWHDLEDERRAIEKVMPDCATIYGSQDLDDREQLLIDFCNGKIQELAGKPVMLGSGTNMQRHCWWEIFFGIGFKFKDVIQAIHRCQRYLQQYPVRIDFIYTEAERSVRRILERKWEQHKQLVGEMSKIIQEYGLAQEALKLSMQRTVGCVRQEVSGRDWTLVQNDSILETANLADNSIGLILTSIPFSTQYEYSPSYNDLGHNENSEAFWQQMDFLTPHLLRILQPGRICAIHVKDRITPGGMTGLGFQVVAPLHAEAIFHYVRHGFGYLGMKTIVTDVVRENNQTYRLGWTEQCKDGTKMGVGMPEYLLLFRKPPTDTTDGYADLPVVKLKPQCDDHGVAAPFDSKSNWKRPMPRTGYSRAIWQFDAHGFARSNGNRLLSSEELRTLPHEKLYKLWRDRGQGKVYDFGEHVSVAEDLDYMERLPATFMLFPPHSWHPDVWTDITRMKTLNASQYAHGRELHLCAMQIDLVERAIAQWTMPGETVYDPFMGIGSVGYVAIQLKRKAIGCELAPHYFTDSVLYLRQAEREIDTPMLFDLLESEA